MVLIMTKNTDKKVFFLFDYKKFLYISIFYYYIFVFYAYYMKFCHAN